MSSSNTLTNPFLLSSIGHFAISLGHTAMGLRLFSSTLPTSPFYNLSRTSPNRTAAVTYRNGWYQGSVFFAILGLINYRWSKDPAGFGDDVTDKPIAALASLVYLVSAWYYVGVGEGGWKLLTAVAAVQGWAAFLRR